MYRAVGVCSSEVLRRRLPCGIHSCIFDSCYFFFLIMLLLKIGYMSIIPLKIFFSCAFAETSPIFLLESRYAGRQMTVKLQYFSCDAIFLRLCSSSHLIFTLVGKNK